MTTLAHALGFIGGPALLQWLQDVEVQGIQDGGRLARLFPPGVNRSSADASRCLELAEAAGVISRVGYTSDPSQIAFKGLHYGGKHPSKREPFVEAVERTWGPGPNRALLRAVTSTSWGEYVEAGAWAGWPRPSDFRPSTPGP